MTDAFPSPSQLHGALAGTLLYLALYLFIFIQFQAFSKYYIMAQKKKEQARSPDYVEPVYFRDVKYYNSRDLLALAGDRSVGNFLEQSILFLPLLWLHALFVDPTPSFGLCVAYTFFRSLYPMLFMVKGVKFILLVSTVPGYLILFYLMFQLMVELI